MRISCDVIKDMLPLYEENVCSQDTAELVECHVKGCRCCREYLESMQVSFDKLELPLEEVSEIKRPFQKIKRHFYLKIILSAIVTACLLVGSMMAYENVAIVHDFFSPQQFTMVQVGEQGCEIVYFDGRPYFELDSAFYKGKIVSDAINSDVVQLNIKSEETGESWENIGILPGGSWRADLRKGVRYQVQLFASEGTYVLRLE